MTKYEKLINARDNFITAAIRAEDGFMKALWINRAENISKELETVSLNETVRIVE